MSRVEGQRVLIPSGSRLFKHPAEESNLVRQIRSLQCYPSHPQGVFFISILSGPSRNRTGHRSAMDGRLVPTASEARAPPGSGGRRSGTPTGHFHLLSIPTWS